MSWNDGTPLPIMVETPRRNTPVFYGTGIPLERGLMHPDRGVMKAMLQAECVTLGVSKGGLFELTQKGTDLIAGIATPGTSSVERSV